MKRYQRYLRLFFLSFYHLAGICLLLALLPLSFLVRRHKKRENLDIIVLSPVAISYDGRIQKSFIKLCKYFDNVCLIRAKDAREDDKVIIPFSDKIRSTGRSGSYSYFPYVFDIFVFLKLWESKNSYVYCHDIQTCLMGFLSSRLLGKVLIADLHEWMSETVNISKAGKVTHLPLLKKKIYEHIERLVLKYADYVISVSHNLGGLMKNKYGIDREILVIRNTGSILQFDFASEDLTYQPYDKEYNHENLNLLYIGQIGVHRNIENLLYALKNCPRFSLFIQGTCSENYKKVLVNLVENLGIGPRVKFLPPVPPGKIIESIKQADIGVMSCKKFSKNLHNSLPNKVFEYIWAEIPFICENLPSVVEMTQGNHFVKFFDSDSIESIIRVLDSIDDQFLKTKREIRCFKEKFFVSDDFEQYEKIVMVNERSVIENT